VKFGHGWSTWITQRCSNTFKSYFIHNLFSPT
jgi:hypothetical protein